MEEKQARKSYKEVAYAHIKQKIIHGALKPGDVLCERDYMAELAMSRTPVREALSQLSDEGMIDIMPSRGMVVSHISVSDVRAVYASRQLIEPYIARQAAVLRDAEALGRFRMLFAAPAPAADPAQDVDMDSDFHLCLAGCIGNRYLLRTEEMLMSQSQRIRTLSSQDSAQREQEARREHITIIDALLAGNADEAAAAAARHLENSMEGYRSILTELSI